MPLDLSSHSPAALYRAALGVLAALCVASMVVYTHEGDEGPLHVAQNAVRSVLAPAGMAAMPIESAAQGIAQGNEDAAASEETLTQLRERNAELVALLAQADELRQENDRLRALVDLQAVYGIEGATGRVIGRSTDAWNQTVTLDVGSDSGVEVGLTVVGSTGVVGQVISVAPTSCVVRELTDPQSGAAALVQSSRSQGVVRGSLAGVLYLENLDADASVSVGDVVLTSGLGGSYVRGLLIGTIVRIDGNPADASRRIVVAPNDVATPLEEMTVVFSASAASALSDATSDADDADGAGDGGDDDGEEG